jgi:hypothetical protein
VVSCRPMSKLVRTNSDELAPIPPLARPLRNVTRNCDADAPLKSTDPRWQDFSKARGDDAIRGLWRELSYRPHGAFIHAAFLGHRGGGKTTEIFRLIDQLRDVYSAVYLEATSEMHLFDIEVEDLLVGLVFSIEQHMREIEKRPLPKDVVDTVTRWFDDVVKTTKWAKSFDVSLSSGLEATAGIPFVGKLFGAVKALFKYDSEHRIEVRQTLSASPGACFKRSTPCSPPRTSSSGSALCCSSSTTSIGILRRWWTNSSLSRPTEYVASRPICSSRRW